MNEFLRLFGMSEEPPRIQWATGPSIELDQADEVLVDALVHEMIEWVHDSTPEGLKIRMSLQLGPVQERVVVMIEEHERTSFKFKISRSGMAPKRMHIQYGQRWSRGYPATCAVLQFDPADDE